MTSSSIFLELVSHVEILAILIFFFIAVITAHTLTHLLFSWGEV